jgi:hypothetical protein
MGKANSRTVIETYEQILAELDSKSAKKTH